jgi:hypothetical protein
MEYLENGHGVCENVFEYYEGSYIHKLFTGFSVGRGQGLSTMGQ